MFGRAHAVPRSQELVFLDADDDLGTIRSKLESSTAEEVYLVVPRRSPVLRTPLEFRILARIANELSSETIVVSDDGSRRRLARNEGFRTRRSLRTLKHLLLAPDEEPPRFVLPDWVPVPRLATLLRALAALALVGLAALLAVPVMSVTLVPQTTAVAKAIDVTVDPGTQVADPSSGLLPGEVLSQRLDVPGAVQIPPDRVVGRDRARGEVIVVSRRGEPGLLSRGTQVSVEEGPTFTTDQDVRLAPGVPVRVGVTAVEPGSGGNVRAGAITAVGGPNADGLEVVNQRPMSGGTDRQAKVVLEEDVARLREQMAAQARDQALTLLRARAGPERTLPERSLRVQVEGEQFDQQVGTEADQLTGRLSATASATVFQNLAYNELVGRMLAASAGADARLSGAPTLAVPTVEGVDGQRVKLRTQASGVVVREIDRDGLLQALRGKTAQEARSYLGRLGGLAQAPQVEVSPGWAPRAFRVELQVQGPK